MKKILIYLLLICGFGSGIVAQNRNNEIKDTLSPVSSKETSVVVDKRKRDTWLNRLLYGNKSRLSYQVSFCNQPLGKVTNAKREARAELEKTKAYELAVRSRLIGTVADSYYMLLTLDRQLEINRATLEAWKKTVRTMEVLKYTGQQNDTDVLQAQANPYTQGYHCNCLKTALTYVRRRPSL